jgi:hypothetical protein
VKGKSGRVRSKADKIREPDFIVSAAASGLLFLKVIGDFGMRAKIKNVSHLQTTRLV